MSYKKIGGYGFNKTNPFLSDTLIHVEKGVKTIIMGKPQNSDLVIDSEGTLLGHSVLIKKIQIDRAVFSKVFVNQVVSWFELSNAGMRILLYILANIEPNRAEFMLNYEDCMTFTKYTAKKTILIGISELLENKIIARGLNPYHFYVNPTVFFNGDRISFLEQYQIK